MTPDEAAHLSQEQIDRELAEVIASPRLNEKYRWGFTRWRLMQAAVAVFAAVTIWGFVTIQHNAKRIENESLQRRADVCASIQEGFDGVHELVDRIIAPTPNPDGTPRELTPQQQQRIKDIGAIADEVLVAKDCPTSREK